MAKRKPTKRKGWHGLSFLAGILLGAGAVGLVALAPGMLSEQLAKLPAAARGQDDLEVVFEFPELLRKSEVPINPESYGDASATVNSAPARRPPATAGRSQTASAVKKTPPVEAAPVEDASIQAAPAQIFIQAASFRDTGEAEQLRARLLLQGLPANMEQVELDDGAWHRVTVGPIDSADKANEVLNRLRQQNLSAIRINPG